MKNKVKFIGFVLFGILVGSACNEKEFLEVNDPNTLDASSFYSNIENFNSSLTAGYSAVKSLDLYGQAFFIETLLSLAHDADYWNAQCRNEVLSTDKWVNDSWRGWYRVISRTNDLIESAPLYIDEQQPNDAQLAELDLIVGQAHFLRGLAYFHLVRLWGESSYADNPDARAVPMPLGIPTSREEMMLPRSTVAEVYSQILTDFGTAEGLLPASWDNDNIARVNRFAAKGFLGQVHMFMGQESTARTYFEEIINAPQYALVPFSEYDDLFQGKNEFSEESIFELNYTIDMQQNIWENGLGSGVALTLAPPGRGWSNFTPHGVNIFRFGTDPRLRVCTYAPDDLAADINGDMVPAGASEFNYTGHSFRKYVPQDYSVYSTNRNSGCNLIIMRLADIYLMYAEILNNNGEDAMASEYMNKIRRRAYGFDSETPEASVDYTAFTGLQLRDSIREERFRELFAEGHRWYDITRWGIVEEEVNKYNEFNVTQGEIIYHDRDYYYPIPLAEIDNNDNMVQSTGY